MTEKTKAIDVARKKLEVFEKEMVKVLPKTIQPERMTRLILTAMKKNKNLALSFRDNPSTFWGAILTAAAMGLEPEINGECYLVALPKNGKYNTELWVGYKGYKKLMYNAGYETITGRVVRENDEFDYMFGTEEYLRHKPCMTGDRGEIIGAYIIGQFRGVRSFDVFGMDWLEKRRLEAKNKLGKGYAYSPWSKWIEEMYLKTALIGFSKLAQTSNEDKISIALKADAGELVDVTPEVQAKARIATANITAAGVIDITPEVEADEPEKKDIEKDGEEDS